MHRPSLLPALIVALCAAPGLAAPKPTPTPTPTPLPLTDPPPPPLQRAVLPEDGPALTQGMKGLEFSLPASGMPTLGVTYFVAPDAAIRLDLGFNLVFSNPTGGSAEADFSLGFGYRLYITQVGRLRVFAQPELVFGRQPATGTGDNHYEFLDLGGALGAQYFFTDHFSVGGSVGLGFNISNIGASSPASVGASLTTSTSDLFAGFYW